MVDMIDNGQKNKLLYYFLQISCPNLVHDILYSWQELWKMSELAPHK